MGYSQLALPMLYARLSAPNGARAETNLERLFEQAEHALVLTYPHGSVVTDSACAVTQLGSGASCEPETVGLDEHGRAVTSAFELARDGGLATGLVSDTRITHATPAGFAAHVGHRSDEDEIAKQLLRSGMDVMLSGGLRHWSGSKCAGSERPGRARPELLGEAQELGYEVALDLPALKASRASRLLGLFGCSGMQNGIEEEALRADPGRSKPTLRDMTEAALGVLASDPDGFILMVEAGQIDWAAHVNDAGTLLHEMWRLDDALEPILEFQEANPETLLLLTADHETGGFGISYSGVPSAEVSGHAQASYDYASPQVLERLAAQTESFPSLLKSFDLLPASRRTASELRSRVEKATGQRLSIAEAERILQDGPNRFYRPDREHLDSKTTPLISDFSDFYPNADDNRAALIARALASRQKVVWSTGTHTAAPVPLAALGPGSRRFRGVLHASEVGAILKDLISRAR